MIAPAALLPIREKPRLRGVSHQIAFFVALVAGAILVALVPAGRRTGAAIYVGSLATLLGVSALYHRPTWDLRKRAWMRRADHSAIFLLIAGTYTPMCDVAIGGPAGRTMQLVVWGGALLGIAKSLFWSRAPRALSTLIYLALGWVGAISSTTLAKTMGWGGVALFLGGGALYSSGAVIYALRRPDPVPTVFGYHEIFHLLVIAAASCHFVAISRMLLDHG